jgi:hypothetical protein
MTTPHEKGDALEDAVAAIEELILRTSRALNDKPILQRKKIINVGGVHHEIDLHVTIDLGSGYEAVFIFECKNWQNKVSKNEIIVFSEKIEESRATKGYFVATSFTSDAEAQAKKDPRIVLLVAREHDPATMPAPVELFARFPQMTKLDVEFAMRGGSGLTISPMNVAGVQAQYNGNRVDLGYLIVSWSRAACDQDLMSFFAERVPEGIYERPPVSHRQTFGSGELFIGDKEMEKLSLYIEYKVTVVKTPLLSHFEVETRGRFYSFGPITMEGDTMQWNVVLSDPN